MAIPQGVPFLLTHLHHIVLPPVAVYILLSSFNTHFPVYANALLYVSSIPVYISILKIKRSIKDAREMKRLGAQYPPLWLGKYPGSVDIVGLMAEEGRTGYLGDHLTKATKDLGSSFGIKILGKLEVSLCVPSALISRS